MNQLKYLYNPLDINDYFQFVSGSRYIEMKFNLFLVFGIFCSALANPPQVIKDGPCPDLPGNFINFENAQKFNKI